MFSQFSINITPFVKREMAKASQARKIGNNVEEFQYLENAHVLGQESTYWHVLTHILMLNWALRNLRIKELKNYLDKFLEFLVHRLKPFLD